MRMMSLLLRQRTAPSPADPDPADPNPLPENRTRQLLQTRKNPRAQLMLRRLVRIPVLQRKLLLLKVTAARMILPGAMPALQVKNPPIPYLPPEMRKSPGSQPVSVRKILQSSTISSQPSTAIRVRIVIFPSKTLPAAFLF